MSEIKIQGVLERVIFHSEETGFTVAKIKEPGKKELTSVVGNLIGVSPGETLELQGKWTYKKNYGEQFEVREYRTVVPATVSGIEKYLGSGLIKGIGPVTAKRIVSHFGLQTLDVIESSPKRLIEVEGVGEKRISMIQNAWEAQKEIKEVMLFLQSNKVSTSYAIKIYKQYGSGAISVVKNDPYRLAKDIYGIGFKTADKIAESLGVMKNSPMRIESGIIHVLSELTDEGHTCYPHDELVMKASQILEVETSLVEACMETLSKSEEIVIEKDQIGKLVFLKPLHVAETSIGRRLKEILSYPRKTPLNINTDKAISWVEDKLGFSLADEQKEAIRKAIEEKVLIITGGPGVGKTTIINAIVRIFSAKKLKMELCAPTGRAAKRISEITGGTAKTIHRLLEYAPGEGGFKRNQQDPLDADVMIVDEASMVDVVLMHHLLKAIGKGSSLILVGDVDQLPPVGPGNALSDIISSGMVPVIRLTEIFRQARESAIITNSHLINKGKFPVIRGSRDFYFIEKETPEEALATIVELVSEEIPSRFQLDPMNDIQVLTPMNRGVLGAGNLNIELQRVLNSGKGNFIQKGARAFYIEDKVMQIRNNYDKEVFNGDIGKIIEIDREEQEVRIKFDSGIIDYDFSDLDEIVLAYGATVHKAQGSEYSCVVMPIHTTHFSMLKRNLLYTAVTRAKRLFVMVGTKKAIAISVRNYQLAKRYSNLESYLTHPSYTEPAI
ncbi:MAG TPA: ATP-dependent RecD-like DNA helicase [Thermodesulfobacteriota bacterium]|nr:ATP-dependent RecD-like DNA helicase [Thermodesulfobacteriota bacterium]